MYLAIVLHHPQAQTIDTFFALLFNKHIHKLRYRVGLRYPIEADDLTEFVEFPDVVVGIYNAKVHKDVKGALKTQGCILVNCCIQKNIKYNIRIKFVRKVRKDNFSQTI